MESLGSYEERIKRAEDVCLRRNSLRYRRTDEQQGIKKEGKKYKLLIQILICVLIYCAFYCIRNYDNNIFNGNLNKFNESLNYDIDFKSTYNYVLNLSKNFFQGSDSQVHLDDKNNTSDNDENLKEVQNVSDFDSDVKFINPLPGGKVSSKFGVRYGNDIVSTNHKGIDLAKESGASIYCSLEGDVEEVSLIGDFGKHLKVKSGEFTTIYGHCSEIIASEGEHVYLGDEIAKVGSTGKSTGPHLHFEIRKNDEPIDPEQFIDFQ